MYVRRYVAGGNTYASNSRQAGMEVKVQVVSSSKCAYTLSRTPHTYIQRTHARTSRTVGGRAGGPTRPVRHATTGEGGGELGGGGGGGGGGGPRPIRTPRLS